MQAFMEVGDPQIEPSKENVVEFFNERVSLLNGYIESLESHQTVYLTTHAYPGSCEISDEARGLVTSQLRFNSLVVDRVAAVRNQLGSERYAVLHLRVADGAAAAVSADLQILGQLQTYVSGHIVPQWGGHALRCCRTISG